MKEEFRSESPRLLVDRVCFDDRAMAHRDRISTGVCRASLSKKTRSWIVSSHCWMSFQGQKNCDARGMSAGRCLYGDTLFLDEHLSAQSRGRLSEFSNKDERVHCPSLLGLTVHRGSRASGSSSNDTWLSSPRILYKTPTSADVLGNADIKIVVSGSAEH